VLNKTIIDAKSTGVKEFEIVSKDWLTGDITIRNYDQLPEKCIIEAGKDTRFYKALDFEHSFSNDKVQETRVRIGIDKKWIKENNISEIDVVRCYPEYERLRASYVSETESEGLYDVYSEGFSTFAILGTYKASSLEIPILEKQLPYFWIIFWVVVAVLLIAFVVVLRKKHMSLTEDVHMKNKWFDFEWKMKLKFNSTPPHQRKFEPH
jgi:PGF-pre-PGF domain-containing protein